MKYLRKSEHFWKLGQNLYKGQKGHFQIICTFWLWEKSSELTWWSLWERIDLRDPGATADRQTTVPRYVPPGLFVESILMHLARFLLCFLVFFNVAPQDLVQAFRKFARACIKIRASKCLKVQARTTLEHLVAHVCVLYRTRPSKFLCFVTRTLQNLAKVHFLARSRMFLRARICLPAVSSRHLSNCRL